mmetsp:Transcript_77225/g.174691  ORF Transcript_77225/g.174691 Transcript_77225/m.174691 type:complete len:214 (-) Transcript_77225:116-757(-)
MHGARHAGPDDGQPNSDLRSSSGRASCHDHLCRDCSHVHDNEAHLYDCGPCGAGHVLFHPEHFADAGSNWPGSECELQVAGQDAGCHHCADAREVRSCAGHLLCTSGYHRCGSSTDGDGADELPEWSHQVCRSSPWWFGSGHELLPPCRLQDDAPRCAGNELHNCCQQQCDPSGSCHGRRAPDPLRDANGGVLGSPSSRYAAWKRLRQDRRKP